MVESRHRAAVAVVDAAGALVRAWGEVGRPVYGRSAIKPLQALPLVETGAADRFGLSQAEIALACASHDGEPCHVETVERWLARIGCTTADLECGAHPPYQQASAEALIRANRPAGPQHNNCSGKHAGFLTTARHLGEPTRGYIRPDHPVQVRILRVLQDMCGLDLAEAPRGTDGCGIPVIAMPLDRTALAMARLAAPETLPPVRAAAARRIVAAMIAEPVMVAGSNRFCTKVIAALAGRAVVKTGAEGVYCAVLPGLGLGVALKVDDGAARAAEVVMGAVLRRLGLIDADAEAALGEALAPPIRNRAGIEVGRLRPVAEALS
ncbi:MAG: asparaginase [Rhodospirillaceae bacterium]|nr:asparaginase [Rhodospirillaceae bacterium]